MHKPVYPPYSQADVDETNLYVTQLPEAFTEIQLHELFGRFGPIVSTKVMQDQCKAYNVLLLLSVLFLRHTL